MRALTENELLYIYGGDGECSTSLAGAMLCFFIAIHIPSNELPAVNCLFGVAALGFLAYGTLIES
jgi:hypothetical protein